MGLSLAGLSRRVERAARAAAQRAKRHEAALKRHAKKLVELEKRKLDRQARAFIGKDNRRRRSEQSHEKKMRRLEREADRRDERERRKQEF